MTSTRRTSLSTVVALLAATASAHAQKPERTITDVFAGFGFGNGATTTLKVGHWVPVAVQVAVRNGAFRGEIELTTPDADGHDATVVIPNVAVPESVNTASQTVYGQIKFGKSDLALRIVLVEIDANGRRTVVDEKNVRLGEGGRAEDLRNGQELVVVYGTAGGLAELKELSKANFAVRAPVVARLRSERDFPTQWYGYGGVDWLIMGTGDERLFDRLDPQRASALRTWVRQGGKLVVSVGKNWQIVRDSFLGPMLPAKLAGVDEIDLAKNPVHTTFEFFADRKAPMELKNAPKMQIAKLEQLRTPGRKVIEHGGRPLVYTAAYGLGQVTLLAFEAEENPFRDWKGATKFWINLLKLRAPTEGDLNESRQYYGGGDYDESQEINNRMEDFPDVTVVPFHWVALLIFLYILLIGPIDYFFLKKVVKRLELTWITFPTWVVIVSAAAYYSAYLLKGDDLRLNRLEVVDVDQTTNTLRGTGFLCIFSPRIDRYSVAYTPGLVAAPDTSWADLPVDPSDPKAGRLGEDQILGVSSWHGVPDETQRGFGAESSPGLLGRRPYRFQPVANGTLLRVQEAPVQVWSVKTFTSQWLGRGEPAIESTLRADGLHLRGTIKNLLQLPLENVVLAFGDTAWMINKLEPNLVVDVGAVTTRGLGDMLRQLPGSNDQYGNRWQRQRQMTGSFADTDNLMRVLLFHRARGDMSGGPRREAGSYHLSGLDLSGQLDFGRAVLLARLPMNAAPAGKLWLNEEPTDKAPPKDPGAKQRTQTYIRVVIDPAKENS